MKSDDVTLQYSPPDKARKLPLLSCLLVLGGLLMHITPACAQPPDGNPPENSLSRSSENLQSPAFAFSAWGLKGPEDLRFGVITQSDKGLYLSRLSDSVPQRIESPPLTRSAPRNESVKPLANTPQGRFVLGPLSETVPEAFGRFQKFPTAADVSLQQICGDQQFDLMVTQAETGYGGVWVNLSALATGRTGFLDLRDYKYLGFWVQAQGPFRLKLADRRWFEKEDALDLGPLSHFYSPLPPLPSALQTQWRQVIVPLANHPQVERLDRSAIANLVLQADPQTARPQHLVFRALQLHQSLPPAEPPFYLPATPVADAEFSGLQTPSQPFHTWVWNTEELLADPGAWSPWIARLKRLYIGEIYLQWPGNAYANPEVLAAFIQALHTAELRVHALDGAPHFAEAVHHQAVFDTLDALARYQASQPAIRRFDGVHFDIEPYLLPGFFGARQRTLTHAYLQLVKAMYERTQALQLPLGLSLPFWLDMPDEFTGEALIAESEGQSAPLYEHLQRYSDYIALMDYKTELFGPAGIVKSAHNELRFAQKHHKKVVIGLETMDLPDEQLFVLKGAPDRERPQGISAVFYQRADALAGDGDSDLEASWQVQVLTPDSVLDANVSTAQSRWYWPLTPYAQVKSEQLSFAKKGPEALTEILQGAENTLGQDPAFGGIALHHSESLFSLMAKAKDPFHFTSKGDPCGLTSVSASNRSSKVIP